MSIGARENARIHTLRVAIELRDSLGTHIMAVLGEQHLQRIAVQPREVVVFVDVELRRLLYL